MFNFSPFDQLPRPPQSPPIAPFCCKDRRAGLHVQGGRCLSFQTHPRSPTLVRLYRHVHRPKLSKYELGETGPYLDSRQTTCPIKRPTQKEDRKREVVGGGCSTLGLA